jgi:hypothetical protein
MSQYESLRPAEGWHDNPDLSRAEHTPLSEVDRLCFACPLRECQDRSRECLLRIYGRAQRAARKAAVAAGAAETAQEARLESTPPWILLWF